MSIRIKNTHKPFSHLPGASCPIPQTPFFLQAYPTRLIICDGQKEVTSIDLDLQGPVEKFTLLLDFEKQKAIVYGFAQQGYFRLEVYRMGKELIFDPVKFPTDTLAKKTLWEGFTEELVKSIPDISLGCHRSQNVEKIRTRRQIEEIIPFWLQLGYFCLQESKSYVPKTGNFFFLEALDRIIQERDILAIKQVLLDLFDCGFSSIFTPKLSDDQFLGIIPKHALSFPNVHPNLLMKTLALELMKLFFQEQDGQIIFLPALPPELHSGRIKGIMNNSGNQFDIEWSKKTLKKMIIWPKTAQDIKIVVPGKKKCRLQKEKHHLLDNVISLQPGEKLFLDRFTG